LPPPDGFDMKILPRTDLSDLVELLQEASILSEDPSGVAYINALPYRSKTVRTISEMDYGERAYALFDCQPTSVCTYVNIAGKRVNRFSMDGYIFQPANLGHIFNIDSATAYFSGSSDQVALISAKTSIESILYLNLDRGSISSLRCQLSDANNEIRNVNSVLIVGEDRSSIAISSFKPFSLIVINEKLALLDFHPNNVSMFIGLNIPLARVARMAQLSDSLVEIEGFSVQNAIPVVEILDHYTLAALKEVALERVNDDKISSARLKYDVVNTLDRSVNTIWKAWISAQVVISVDGVYYKLKHSVFRIALQPGGRRNIELKIML